MKQWLRALVGVAVMTVAAASANAGDDWQNIAFVSNTLDVSSSRLCLGAPSTLRGSDIGCPTYAPYVSNSGYVGIGTTNPAYSLDVNGDLRIAYDKYFRLGYNNASYNQLYMNMGWAAYGSQNNYWDFNVVTRGLVQRWMANGDVYFPSGRVGIGTLSPQATLQVSGSMIVSVTGQTTTPTMGHTSVATGLVQKRLWSLGLGLPVPTWIL